jgi:hypothetical protein
MTRVKKKFERRTHLDKPQDEIDNDTNKSKFEANRGFKINKVGKKK